MIATLAGFAMFVLMTLAFRVLEPSGSTFRIWSSQAPRLSLPSTSVTPRPGNPSSSRLLLTGAEGNSSSAAAGVVDHSVNFGRDRDGVYGKTFRQRVRNMGIEEVLTAPQSPWQNPYAERLNGSIRRECLNHLIVLNERHLRRILRSYFDYYLHSRTHLSLDRNSPIEREVEPPDRGKVIAIPQVGGLHHRYCRAA